MKESLWEKNHQTATQARRWSEDEAQMQSDDRVWKERYTRRAAKGE